jgi:hypothetical protein
VKDAWKRVIGELNASTWPNIKMLFESLFVCTKVELHANRCRRSASDLKTYYFPELIDPRADTECRALPSTSFARYSAIRSITAVTLGLPFAFLIGAVSPANNPPSHTNRRNRSCQKTNTYGVRYCILGTKLRLIYLWSHNARQLRRRVCDSNGLVQPLACLNVPNG